MTKISLREAKKRPINNQQFLLEHPVSGLTLEHPVSVLTKKLDMKTTLKINIGTFQIHHGGQV